MRPITRLKGLRIEAPKFEATLDYYTRGFGLKQASRDESRAVLKGAGSEEAVLEVSRGSQSRLLGLRFALASTSEVALARAELEARGLKVETSVPNAISIEDPDGRQITFEADGNAPDATPTPDGLPLFISHVVLNSADQPRLMSFFLDVLGFKVADRYEKDSLVFLRCAQPQHHCIGISPAPVSTLNHFSVDVGSIDGVMRGVGRMQKLGHTPIWGPGRHGPGGNVFCYFEDPNGFVAEFTCDVIQIEDEAGWVAKEWPRVPDIGNVWGTGGPSQRAIDLMGGKGQISAN